MTIDLEALYIDLHRHPELSSRRPARPGHRAAATELGLEFEEGVGLTGVAADPQRRGPGRLAARRHGRTPRRGAHRPRYASTARGTDPSGLDVPVMHACGHDMHVTALLGALERRSPRQDEWSGTIVALFQPAEEYGAGSQAMIADGVLDRFPKPDIVLGQHVTPLPTGTIGVRPGTQMAASDGLTVMLLRSRGHGSRPHSTIDPIVHGGGDRHAPADDRLARGRPARCRRRHGRLDPRGAEEQHHPRRGEARAEPALPRRRGPRPCAREGRAHRQRGGAASGAEEAARDHDRPLAPARRSTTPPRRPA